MNINFLCKWSVFFGISYNTYIMIERMTLSSAVFASFIFVILNSIYSVFHV